jgi:GAF domain-containing protein
VVPTTTRQRLLDVLTRTAFDVMAAADADACAVSRAIGDLLVLVTQAGPADRPIEFDRSFLISEYPETQRVLATGRPWSAHVGQPRVDAAEERLLVEVGFGAILMLPLVLRGESWGLVEVYREAPRPFRDADARAGELVLAALS